MSEQQERDLDANERSEDDESAMLEDLQQELKDHTAAFNPETASEAEKVNFRRIRNAIYSRIKYRRRSRLMKSLSAQKADLERRNKLIRESNAKLEGFIKVATTIAESQEVPQNLFHHPTQALPYSAQQPIDPLFAVLDRMKHGTQTNNTSSLSQSNFHHTLAAGLTPTHRTGAQQPFSNQHHQWQQDHSQQSAHEGQALLPLLNQFLREPPSHQRSGTAASTHSEGFLNPVDLSWSFLQDLALQRAHSQQEDATRRAESHEALLPPHYTQSRSAIQTALDLLSVEIFQLELNRRFSGYADDPQLASILQAIVLQLLQMIDGIQQRQSTPPEALLEEITMLRLCVDLMKSLVNTRNHPSHQLNST